MLSDLAVFTEYAYAAAEQVVAQQVVLFNEAAQGTFILRAASHTGDFSEVALWKRLAGLIRRRNPYGDGNIPEINFSMLTENMVRVAAGTPAVRMDPSMFRYIGQDPQTRGAAMGQQLGQDMLRDMFNVGLGALIASHSQVAALTVDHSDTKMDMKYFNEAQSKYGDRWQDLQAWVMHSTPLFGLWDKVFANEQRLFTFGNLNVLVDPFGRPFIVTDAPGLVIPASGVAGQPGYKPQTYFTLGVKPGAVAIDQNDDFKDNFDTRNGRENIVATYQAEWTYNVGVRAFAWDKTAGGKSPTDAALHVSTNWDRVDGYNDRDLACVMVKTQ